MGLGSYSASAAVVSATPAVLFATRMKSSIAVPVTALVAAIGAAVSAYLVRVHIDVKSGGGSSGVCDISATVNCDAAAASAYSELLGIPIAVIGLAGYVATLLLLAGRANRSEEASEPLSTAGFLQTFFAASVLYSVFLALISVFVLPALCPACIALYAVNIAGLVVTSFWTQVNPLKTLIGQLGRVGEALARPAAITFIVATSLVIAAGTGYTRSAIAGAESDAPAPKRKVDPALIYSPQAPARGPSDAPLKVAVFSDFQCPYCSKFAKTLTFAEETFGPQLRIEFRNYPLPFHQFAPIAAAMGVCAHRTGQFWEFHDGLFADQSRVNPAGLRELGGELGLDPSLVDRCVTDPEVKRILEADQAAGRAVGVTGTPAFVVNGTFYNGALPIEELTRVLEDELEKVTARSP